MRKGILKNLVILPILLLFSSTLFAQSSGSSSSPLLLGLGAVAVLVVFAVITQVSDNLLAIEGQRIGAGGNLGGSFFSGFRKLFRGSLPEYLADKPVIELERGMEIPLEGEPAEVLATADVKTFAVQPPNFRGIAPIPKLLVEVGAEVKAGEPLFFDKGNPDMKFVAPVSGEVIEINRGAKRAITEIVILADKDQQYHSFEVPDISSASREELVNFMLESGVWTTLRQRPYDVLASTDDVPSHIFISTFDTAPLAPDLNFVVSGKGAAFQRGLDVLAKLTSGQVHLGLNGGGETPPAAEFVNAGGVEKHWFAGKHPAGNVGIQIHHIAPITGSTKVWTIGVQDVITLGTLFLEGVYRPERIVALVGDELHEQHYVKTFAGAKIGDLVAGKVNTEKKVRIISGDVLSGTQKDESGFLDIYEDQVTVIEEGDYYEMFGWLVPQKGRPSLSPTFPGNFFSGIKYDADTNTHGEKRAFVVTGEYEAVLPMDIYVQHLMKSILVNDFEKMEGLGLYELIEEDVALCEFVCTSKQPLQQILRRGLNTMYEQG